MDGHPQKRKLIESEMDRFEQEISSLAPPRTSFIPTQLRRPVPPPPPHGMAPPGTLGHRPPMGVAIPPPPKPSPIIISGAPQVYNAPVFKSATSMVSAPPQISQAFASSMAATSSLNKPSTSLSAGVSSSSIGFGVTGPSAAAVASSATASSSLDVDVRPSSSTSFSNSLTEAAAAAAKKLKKKKKKKAKEGEEKKPKKLLRSAGGQIWEDTTLLDWDPSDFRLFCGDLGNDVTDEVLTRVFGRYPSFQKAKVVRDKRTNKTKGFGFVSFKDPNDFVRAIKELDGRYVGSRPIKLRKSNWRHRNIDQARKKDKERTQILTLIQKK